jgi:hypothetical protein
MIKLHSIYLVVFSAILLSCNTEDATRSERTDKDVSQLNFAKDTIDIGDFKSGTKRDINFYAINTSDVPLIIDTMQASCSCTIGSYSKKPILKNDSGLLVVTFNPKPGVFGYFEKSVVVAANTKPVFSVLTIKGNIVP